MESMELGNIINALEKSMIELETKDLNNYINVSKVYETFMENIKKCFEIKIISNHDIICLCKCKYVSYVELWNVYENKCELEEFLKILLKAMMAVDVNEIENDAIDSFCGTGELIAGTLEKCDEWIYFKKIYITLLMKNRQDEAKKQLYSLKEIIPNDNFVIEMLDVVEYANKNLNDINSIMEYIKAIKINIHKYIVIIAGRDTIWGHAFNQCMTSYLKDMLKLKYNLYGMFRRAYLAVIDGGNVIAEELGTTSEASLVQWKGNVDGEELVVESRGYGCAPKVAKIFINNALCYESIERGINIVVLNKESKQVEDIVAFDVFSENITCTRQSARNARLEAWSKDHPDVYILCCKEPMFPKDNLTYIETLIRDNHINFSHYYNEYDKIDFLPLKHFFACKEDVIESIEPPASYYDFNGVRRFDDKIGNVVNIISGHRITKGQPKDYTNTIYLVGGCKVFGVGCHDQETIASYLQKLCNDKVNSAGYIVENYGFFLAGEDKQDDEEMRILESLPVKQGDIVICFFGEKSVLKQLDLSNESIKKHEYGEIFYDADGHMTPNGNKMVADKIYSFLGENGYFNKSAIGSKTIINNNGYDQMIKTIQVNEDMEYEKNELVDYKKMLMNIYEEKLTVGSIVMNCNPFTLGHRYLIEQAAKQCRHLIVFVVEEDKSVFEFKDRIRLVKEGIKDIDNVTVLRSGKFVLSSYTFSEYFNKAQLQDRVIDASLDIDIFGKEIAPCLHITKRFVGTEPKDKVTNQYNMEMKKSLPRYGIEVIEIPRIERNGLVISASEVRKCIKNKNIESVKNIVPESTYKFILHNMNEIYDKL